MTDRTLPVRAQQLDVPRLGGLRLGHGDGQYAVAEGRVDVGLDIGGEKGVVLEVPAISMSMSSRLTPGKFCLDDATTLPVRDRPGRSGDSTAKAHLATPPSAATPECAGEAATAYRAHTAALVDP